ncbi:MAG TPA: tetratricopeptide repeat protein, partial [Rhizomicrobium sp.]|nr:tetratricopeptide repeat protein [Rhizomicrobium sp.]
MVTLQANPAVPQTLALASQSLQAGDAEGADRLLAPALERFSADPRLLHMAGLVRMHQQRFEEAANFFAAARAANPREAVLAFSHGTALRWLERHREAIDAFKDAITLKPDYAEAYYEAGTTLQQLGEVEQAEKVFRQWLAALPDNPRGRLALADVLLVMRRPQEAETFLREALRQPVPQQMRAILHKTLGFALYRQNRNQDALENYEKSSALNPELSTDAIRVDILQRLRRYEEAGAISRRVVAQDPTNPKWHKFHNDLMYRLGDPDYLKSYDRAPKTVELLLSKAYFLGHEKRGEEAYEVHREALALAPDNLLAAAGVGNTLNLMKRHADGLKVLEELLTKHSDDADLLSCAAEAAISAGD